MSCECPPCVCIRTRHVCFAFAAHAIISLYEAAAPAAPAEDFLASMFVAYARVGHHVKMQQTAMRLAKVTRNDKYLAWAAVNMAFQVRAWSGRGRVGSGCVSG